MRVATRTPPRATVPRTLVVHTSDGLRVYHLTDYDPDEWDAICVLAEFLAFQVHDVIADSLSCTALHIRLRRERDDLGGFAAEREGA